MFVAPFLPAPASAQFPATIDLAQEAADVTVYGASASDKAGAAVSSGDYNGDGQTDWVVFSGGASPLGRSGVGVASVFWGGSGLASAVMDLALPLADVTMIVPPSNQSGIEASLTSGDFNKDGYDDLVVGHPCTSSCAGQAFIVFGGPVFPDTLDLENTSSPITSVLESLVGAHFGLASVVGDINGDTYDDLIMSAPASAPGWGGATYVIYGRTTFPDTIALGIEQPSLTRIIDYEFGWGSGHALAADDLSKDGFCDILIGSYGYVAERNHGKATLVYGASNLPDTLDLDDNNAMMTRIYSDVTQTGGALGSAVAFGDVNGDQNLDIIVGAEGVTLPASSEDGEVFIFFGTNPMPDSIHVNSSGHQITRIIGPGPFQRAGSRLLSRDFNADGLDDVVISSWPGIAPPDDVYKIYVLYGALSIADTVFLADDSLVTRVYGESSSDWFGDALGADDLNADGVIDLFLGALFGDPPGRPWGGKVYLLYGSGWVTGIPRLPEGLWLQNHPNPFQTNTVIQYELARPSPVALTIYNVLGQQVIRFDRPILGPGAQSLSWDGRDASGRRVASGIYFLRLQAGGVSQTRRMVLVR